MTLPCHRGGNLGQTCVMVTRAEALFQRLQRLLPPPDAEGWHYTRLRVEAGALGDSDFSSSVATQDAQAGSAEAQLRFGKRLSRVDESPLDWDLKKATSWLFNVSNPDEEGATGFFADVWGRTLGVGRLDGETDADYAKRTLLGVTKKTLTNKGMASFIEDSLGISGVDVFEADTALSFYRLNEGDALNDPSVILNSSGDVTSSYACFIVSMSIADEALKERVVSLANSQKAAGTRLVAVVVRSTDGYGYAQYGVSRYGGV